MKKLIIAEKPELARAVATALIGNYTEKNGIIENDEYCITWAFGHILTLVEPEDYDKKYEDRNNIELLPIYFENWKRCLPKDKVFKNKKIQDNAYKRNRFKLIASLLEKYESVIHCGDPDEEGQLLIDEILEYCHYKGKVERVLINDNLPENIVKQFNNLKNNKDYRQYGASAYARQMADKCFGINHSRLASARLGKPLVIGRVITPTLNLVVTRDNEIDCHVQKKFYEIYLKLNVNGKPVIFSFKPEKQFLDDESHMFDKNKVQDLAAPFKKGLRLPLRCEVKRKDVLPPLPYNATELQADMNAYYEYSLSKTLAITQTLREKYQAITYNRSDCQYLSMQHHSEASNVLPVVMNNIHKQYPLDYTICSKCFNDSKITAHHGIIPQQKKIDINSMTEEERNVYISICERYMMQFLPPKVIENSKLYLKGKTGTLVYSSTRCLNQGYEQYFKNNDEKKDGKENHLFFDEGTYEGVVLDSDIKEGLTNPSPRYTPKTLIKDMCGISKYVKDEEIKKILMKKDDGKEGEKGSIGTVATRSQIVDNLIQKGYVELKNNKIISTKLGKEFCALLPEDVKSPDTTAEWWLIQEEIKNGRAGINAVMMAVVHSFAKHKDSDYQNGSLSKQALNNKSVELGQCPVCGGKIIKGKYGYFCENKDFKMPLEVKIGKEHPTKVTITNKRAMDLLKGKSFSTKLVSNGGKEYTANLTLKVVKDKKGISWGNLDFLPFKNKK